MMILNKKNILTICIIISSILFYVFFIKESREERLTKEGDHLIEQIEKFRKENGRLPISFKEVDYEPKTGSEELYYNLDSNNYTISFGMSIDYNKTYYSDIKQWSYKFREMK